MEHIEIDKETLEQAYALLDEFKDDTLGPTGSLGQPALCETLKQLSNCLAGMNKKYGNFVLSSGDPAAGFVDILNATYAINDMANILNAAGDYKTGEMSREESAYEIAYGILDLGGRLTGGIGKLNFGATGTYCSLILGTGAACLKYGKSVIDLRLAQLEDATIVLDNLDNPEVWPEDSGDLKSYLLHSGIEESDVEELISILEDLETDTKNFQANIRYMDYLKTKRAAEEIDDFIANINQWVKECDDTHEGETTGSESTTSDDNSEVSKSNNSGSYKGSNVSKDKYSSILETSSSSSSSHGHLSVTTILTPHRLYNEIEFTPNDFTDYFKELMNTDPEKAQQEYSDLLDNIEKAKGYLYGDDTLESLEDLVDEIADEIPDIAGDEYEHSTDVQPPRDPLIIDLGGDGFSLKQVDKGVHFDLDKNGFAEKTGWAEPSEGFLAIDKNKSTFIDDGGELFGDQYVKSDGTTAVSGFDALRDLDDDIDEETGKKGNGIIDKYDSRFGELLVWKDLNQNGVSEENELQTLEEAGIESISLEINEGESEEVETGIIRSERSTVTKTNGDTVDIAEHWFQVKSHDTVEHDDDGNIITADSVDTFGNVRNLSDAIEEDDTRVLAGLVDAFKSSSDYAEKRVLIKKILFTITDSNDIGPGTRGGNIDARELNVIEKFMGRDFIGAEVSSTPNSLAAPMLKEVYYKLENLYFNLLNKESEAGKYLDQVLVNRDENGVPSLDYTFFNYSTALRMMLGDDVDDSVYSVASVLRQYDLAFKQTEFDTFTSDYTELSEHFSDMADMIKTGSVIYGGESGDKLNGSIAGDIIWGDGGSDTIKAGGGRDFIYGGEGDDVLEGGDGDDNYYFGNDHGKDTVKDRSGSTKLIFTDGISEDDYSSRITVSGKAISFTLENAETGDRVDLPDFIADPTNYSFIFEGSDSVSGVADERDTVNGTDGDDYLDASDGFNIFYGGEGDDTLAGGKDIDFMYGGNGNDLLLGRNGTNIMYGEGGNDTIYDGDDSGFLSGGTGDDMLYGGGGADVLDGGAGNDYLQGDHGNDTYIFGKGYDEDTIAASSDLHTIVIHDYTPGQMHCVRYHNNDLIIDFGSSNTDKLIVKSFFDFNANRDYNFVFDNGTVLGQNDIVAESAPIVGTDGDDYLYATDGNDTLDGGAGNDTLCGAGGTDKYIFGKGYGSDSINEWGSDKSVIVFKDIRSDEVTIADQWGSNLQIFVNDSEDVLTVNSFKWGQATYDFEFADGAKGYVDKNTWEFVFTKQPNPVEEDIEQAAAELLDTLYSDTADISSDLLSGSNDTVISELTDSVSANEENVSDLTDIQALLLAENMSAFGNDDQISDNMNIADITSDTSLTDSLLVGSLQ